MMSDETISGHFGHTAGESAIEDSSPIVVLPAKATTLAWADVSNSFRHWRLAYEFSKEDLKQKFHRTLIGPFWIAASFLVFILVKIYIFSSLNDSSWEYFASYLTLGYMVWVFISTAIVDGAMVFIGSRGWILGMKCDYTTFVLQAMFRSFVTAIITAVVALLVAYFVYPYTAMGFVWGMIGFISIIPLLLCVQLILATLCVFIRDLLPLIQAIMRIMFFLTPIIWLPSMLGAKADILKYNPFTHMLAVVRQPLLSEPVLLENWIWIGALTLAAFLVAVVLYPFAINKIARHI